MTVYNNDDDSDDLTKICEDSIMKGEILLYGFDIPEQLTKEMSSYFINIQRNTTIWYVWYGLSTPHSSLLHGPSGSPPKQE